MSNSHIHLKDLSVSFGSGSKAVQVLENVELDVRNGEFVSLIGHSGCGKSTLLNLVSGLVSPTSGTCTVSGSSVTGPGPDRMMVFQNHSLLPWMTVRENIALAANTVHKNESKSQRQTRVDEMLRTVGLDHAADKRPDEISGGMKQRAGIGRALITEPEVLLMDEPFGALDALTRGKLQESLLDIWERHRITVLMVTHDVDEAILLSDRIVMMSNGPNAKVAEIIDVKIPRPRKRLEAVNHPTYYQYRNRLTRFLNDHRRSAPVASRRKDALQLGFIPLSDCAPIIMAKELGHFEDLGLDVELSREPSWRAVSKGIMAGRLDASMMLAPTTVRHNGNPDTTEDLRFSAGMVLSRNGDAITLNKKLQDVGVVDRATLATWVKRQPPNRRPVFGVVFRSSMHNLMARDWLLAGGIEPGKDMDVVVIPPPQMVANLELGNLVGFCVGEPWNSLAIQKGIGFVPRDDKGLWPHHPEKVIGYRSQWAKENPDTVRKLVAALMKSCAYCADLDNRQHVVDILSQRWAVNQPAEVFQHSMFDRFDYGDGTPVDAPGFHRFSVDGSAHLHPEELDYITEHVCKWKLIEPEIADAAKRGIFDECVYLDACKLANSSPYMGPAISLPNLCNELPLPQEEEVLV